MQDLRCKWKVYVRRLPREHTSRLRSYEAEHTCRSDEKGKNCLAKAGWVANQIEQQIRDHKEFKPKDVQTEIWSKYGVKVSYHIAYYARIICYERIYGNFKAGYTMCPEACRQLLQKNHGSVIRYFRHPNDYTFVGFFCFF